MTDHDSREQIAERPDPMGPGDGDSASVKADTRRPAAVRALRLACLGLAVYCAVRGQQTLASGHFFVHLTGFAQGWAAGAEGLVRSLLGWRTGAPFMPASFSGIVWYVLGALFLFLAAERFRPRPIAFPWRESGLILLYILFCALLGQALWGWGVALAATVGVLAGSLLAGTLRLEQAWLAPWQTGAWLGIRMLLIGAAVAGETYVRRPGWFWPVALGGLALTVAVWIVPAAIARRGKPAQEEEFRASAAGLRRAEAILAGLGTFFLIAFLQAWAGVAFVAVLAALVIAGWFGRAPLPRDLRAPRAGELALLAAILVVGTFFRFHQLDAVPPGCHYDEACNGLEAVKILRGQHSVYTEIGNGKTTLFFYYIAAAFKVFGVSVEAMRGTAAANGVLVILAVYLMGRYYFGGYAGLGAALFLALSRWHITFSRIAFMAVQLALFMIGAFLLYQLAVRTRRLWVSCACAIGAGVFLSLNLYSYMAGRVVPLLFLAFLVLQLATQRGFVRRNRVVLPLMLLAFLVTSIPIHNYATRRPDVFWMRMKQVRLFPDDAPLEHKLALVQHNATRTLLQFDYEGDGNARHNLPAAPALHPWMSALFGVGLAYLFLLWRNPGAQIVLLWFFVMLVPGFVSVEAPQALRTVPVVPALAVAAGVAVGGTWRVLRDVFPARVERWSGWPAPATVGVLALCALYLTAPARAQRTGPQRAALGPLLEHPLALPLVQAALAALVVGGAAWAVWWFIGRQRSSGRNEPEAAGTQHEEPTAVSPGLGRSVPAFAAVGAALVWLYVFDGAGNGRGFAVWATGAGVLAALAWWLRPAWVRSWQAGHTAAVLLLAALTIQIWPGLYRDYFYRYGRTDRCWEDFAGRFPLIARYLNQLPPETEVYTDSTGEATLDLLAPDVNMAGKADLVRYVPLHHMPKGDVVFVNSYPHERPDVTFWLRHLYPECEVEEHRSPPPMDVRQFESIRISKDAIKRHMGLLGTYETLSPEGAVIASATRIDGFLHFDPARVPPPLERADRVTWSGTYYAPDARGTHLFEVETDAPCRVSLDGGTLIETDAGGGTARREVELDRGLHGVVVQCTGAARFRLLAQRPGTRQLSHIPERFLHDRPLPVHGLLGTYWSNRRWTGQPLHVWIDPAVQFRWQVTPGWNFFSVRWQGKLWAERAGRYRFFTLSNDYSRVAVDDVEVLNSGNSPQDHTYLSGAIDLERGMHDLVVDYADFRGYSVMKLEWQPPGGSREVVPSKVLYHPWQAGAWGSGGE